jgi:shikimate dehydrogenase
MPEYFPRPVSPPLYRDRPVRVGLLGRGIQGSLSPRLHSRAAALCGISLEFRLFDVEREAELGPLLRRLHGERWDGLSVTMPWKTRLESHLLGMSPDAISVGGVNLLLRSEEGWIGENSDIDGFVAPLARRRLVFRRALVTGTGGAARAVLHSLASMPFVEEVWVRGRRRDAAQLLVDEFGLEPRHWTALGWDDAPQAPPDLLVNATPLGTEDWPEDGLPCPAEWIGPSTTCYDLVYRPRETAFLREARRRGAATVEGLEMLLAQARRAFESWTGCPFPGDALAAEWGLAPLGLTGGWAEGKHA